jgi:phosphoribosylanthranilate isomerase
MSVWVKICGVTRVEDALAAVDAGADAIGVNFCPESPRACSLARAAEIAGAVADRIVVYGVFVDLSRHAIERVLQETGITGVQLHGSEDPALCRGWSVPVLRSVAVRDRAAFDTGMQTVGDFDSASPLRALLDNPRGGGSGRGFDAGVVEGANLSEVVVAGGLGPTNVAGVIGRLRPWGVDTASGVESRPGVKDAKLIKEFIENARSA